MWSSNKTKFKVKPRPYIKTQHLHKTKTIHKKISPYIKPNSPVQYHSLHHVQPWCHGWDWPYSLHCPRDKSAYRKPLAESTGYLTLPCLLTCLGPVSWLILGLSPANERRCYFVTTSLIGWAQT